MFRTHGHICRTISAGSGEEARRRGSEEATLANLAICLTEILFNRIWFNEICVGEIVVDELLVVDAISFDMRYFEESEARRTILSATYVLAIYPWDMLDEIFVGETCTDAVRLSFAILWWGCPCLLLFWEIRCAGCSCCTEFRVSDFSPDISALPDSYKPL